MDRCINCNVIKRIKAKNRCNKCYLLIKKPNLIHCKSCGVEKEHKAKGLCRLCYEKQSKRPIIVCSTCGEKEKHQAYGLCKKCYMKIFYSKRVKEQMEKAIKEKKRCKCGCGEIVNNINSDYILGHYGCSRMNLPAWNKGLTKFTNASVLNISKNMSGDKSHSWKGDNVDINSLHQWIRRNLKIAKKCEFCGRESRIQLANKHKHKKYTRDINDYHQLCGRCHIHFDKRLSNLIQFPKKIAEVRSGEIISESKKISEVRSKI